VQRAIETVVIGAGQAGLIMSWHLQRAGRDHIVLDRRETLGGGWQDRWDQFVLVGPNWTTGLPGFAYEDGDPDGFMPRDAVAARMRRYAEVIGAPVERSTEVTRLSLGGAGGHRFHLETSQGPIDADDIIVATGAFHRPKLPPAAEGISCRSGGAAGRRAGTAATTSSSGSGSSSRGARNSEPRCRRSTSSPSAGCASPAIHTSRATTAATTRTCARWPSTESTWPAGSRAPRANE
jgi:glycine/D-amino acid oxidase-like deaminating enzyme